MKKRKREIINYYFILAFDFTFGSQGVSLKKVPHFAVTRRTHPNMKKSNLVSYDIGSDLIKGEKE